VAAALLTLAMATACAPKASRRQTDIMEKSGKIGVSSAVLRARVNDLADRFAGKIERTADEIIAETEEDTVRRRALVMKVDAIPAVYAAGFRADPLAAAIDLWGFAFQFDQYMESGRGRTAFGAQHPVVLTCARELISDADGVIRGVTIRPEYFDKARARVEGWAKTNLVEHGFSTRASGAALVADLRSANQDVFVSVGQVTDLIGDLSERLNTYAAQLPKQARWEAEILLTGMTGPHGVEGALGDLHGVATAAGRATEFLGDVPGLIDAERDIVAAERRAVLVGIAGERRAVLAGVDAERVRTQEFATGERLAILDAARAERVALVAALHQERVATLVEIDAIKTRAVDSALAGVRDLIDYTLWRLTAMMIGLMLAAGVIGALAYRLAVRRAT
jgi:hypothetical protein